MNRMIRRWGLLTLSAGVLLVNGPNPRGAAHAQTAEHSSAPRSGESAQAKIARPPPRLARPAVAFATDQFTNRVRRWNASV